MLDIEVKDVVIPALKGEKGDTGEKGDKGDTGAKPVAGVDYYTPEEKEEFKEEVIEESKDDIETLADNKMAEYNNNATTKMTAYNTNHSEKMTIYNNNHTAKMAEYNANASDVITKNIAISNFIDSELDTKELEETSILATDSANWYGKIEPKARTEQESLNGNNMLDVAKVETGTKNGITCTYNSETQEITFDGTCTEDNTRFEFKPTQISMVASTTRIIAFYTSGTVSGYCTFRLYDNTYNRGTFLDLNVLSQETKRRTSLANYTYSAVLNSIRFNSGSVVNNFKIRIMVENGNAYTYEKYCGNMPAPNPDYPQGIKVVTGSNIIKHKGKNEFYGEDLGEFWYNDNTHKFPHVDNFYAYICKVRPNTEYTISKRYASNRFVLITSEDRPTRNSPYTRKIIGYTGSSVKEYTFTTQDNENWILFGVYAGTDSAELALAIADIQLEKGAVATEYEPYKLENYNLNLGSVELCKIGDYSDIIFKNVTGNENYDSQLDEGAWYKKSIIGEYVFDGTETNVAKGSASDSTYSVFQFASLVNLTNINSALCDRLVYSENINSPLAGESLYLNSSFNYAPRICVKNSRLETVNVAGLLQYLSSHNIKMKYVKVTPAFTKITDATLISQLEALNSCIWFKGVNNWETETENLEPTLKGTYKQSNILRIQALEQANVGGA